MRIAAVIAASSVLGVASFQDARAPRPTFRGGVDVLTIEVAVRDASGRPAADLQASDFIVSVDGKPRKVISARLFQAPAEAAPVEDAASAVPHHLTNTD